MNKWLKLFLIILALAAIVLLAVFTRMKFVYILLAILVLAFIIFFHELGHFAMGKLLGFRVLDFSLGFGPALIKFRKGETNYAIRAIPFGGACQFDGEDDEAEEQQKKPDPETEALKYGDVPVNTAENTEKASSQNEKASLQTEKALSQTEKAAKAEKTEVHKGKRFNAQPVWKRFLVIFAGPFMNILLAFLIALCVMLIAPEYIPAVDAETGDNIPMINEVIKDSPAESAGIKAGDRVIAVNGQPTMKKDDEQSIDALVRLIGGAGNDLTLTVERGTETLEIAVTGAYDPQTNSSKIGISITNLIEGTRHRNLWEAIAGAFDYLVFIVKTTFEAIGHMFTHGIHQGDVSGVVGTVAIMVDVAKTDISNLAVIAVILSLSLGIFNLIPFPALDGGRLLFLIIEAIKGKPLNRKVEGIVNAVGLMLLFGLMIVVTVFDVIGLFK